MSNRFSFSLLLLAALLSWIGLVLFTRLVPPASIEAFLTFFVILMVALISTFTPTIFVLGKRILFKRRYRMSMRLAVRQSVLLTLVVVLNLMLKALRSWNLAMAIVILGAAVVVEILFLARK
jgi:hypothetical protein